MELSEKKQMEPIRKPLRKFICRNCGKLIQVETAGDRRTVFCCSHCERQYWRKPKHIRERRKAIAEELAKVLI